MALLTEMDTTAALGRVEKIKAWQFSFPATVCSERAVLVTEAYRETEGEPMILRRARAFERFLAGMSIYIGPYDLLAGALASTPWRAPLYPEFSSDWIEDELDSFELRQGDRYLVAPEDKARVREILPYWRGRTLKEHILPMLPPALKLAIKDRLITHPVGVNQGCGHITVDYEKVLRVGLGGIIAEAEARLDSLELSDPAQFPQQFVLQGAIRSCRAVIALANRYAGLAETQAEAESDPQRREELLQIAAVCRRVPEHPARGFREALQSFWFVHLAMQLESNGVSYSPGRFDQYMHPHYQASLADGSITKDQAQELVDCLWLKFNEFTRINDITFTKQAGGMPLHQNLIVGGQTADGDDATNELSYICMDATTHVRMPQPSFSMRFHRRTPEPFLLRALELARMGLGLPAMYNDEMIIPALLNRGIPMADARNYCIVGCVEPSVPGKEYGEHGASKVNLGKCLELVLNDGACPHCGTQLGPRTGDVEQFHTFDQFMDAYRVQVAAAVKLMVSGEHAISMATPRVVPMPFLSSLVNDCIGRGKELADGGAHYTFVSPQGIGLGTAGDCLATVKAVVYDENRVAWPELKRALEANFEGFEGLRQILVNAPKYGNDIDWVDRLAREAGQVYCREVERYSNIRGTGFQPGLYPATAHVTHGASVGATPDGRRAGTPLSDGVSPTSGRDVNGPTAMLKSASKLDHMLASNGTLLNIKFHPSALAERRDLQKLAHLVRSYFLLGGMHLQFNVIAAETLRAAQRDPEGHRDLVVRVAGYSAFFTTLEKVLQDDIIGRTEHQLA